LAQLHAPDITGKHRLLLVVGAASKHVVLRAKIKVRWRDKLFKLPPLALNAADRQFPPQGGAKESGNCATAQGSDAGDMFDFDIVFELAFGDVAEVSGLPLIDTLQSMHHHVFRIVDIADELFFKYCNGAV
jgi:hypothetical protein